MAEHKTDSQPQVQVQRHHPVTPPPNEQLPFPYASDPHAHFCTLIGIPNPQGDAGAKPTQHPWTNPLYPRVQAHFGRQRREYNLTAAFSNSLLLLQVLIGAVVTALAASSSPHIVTTVFGALNTVIAGLIAYFKSRGQPMRSRAFRDELEGCISEIEDAEARLWAVSVGGAFGGHRSAGDKGDLEAENEQGKEEDWRELVREEVVRLTAMYDEAVQNSRRNFPDLWVKSGDTSKGGSKVGEKKTEGAAGVKEKAAPHTHRKRESAEAGGVH